MTLKGNAIILFNFPAIRIYRRAPTCVRSIYLLVNRYRVHADPVDGLRWVQTEFLSSLLSSDIVFFPPPWTDLQIDIGTMGMGRPAKQYRTTIEGD